MDLGVFIRRVALKILLYIARPSAILFIWSGFFFFRGRVAAALAVRPQLVSIRRLHETIIIMAALVSKTKLGRDLVSSSGFSVTTFYHVRLNNQTSLPWCSAVLEG